MTGRDSDLLKNILLFARILRSRKVGVTIDNVTDALRGISFIDLQRKDDFYSLLKSIFVSTREEIRLFDELFEQFWSVENRAKPFNTKPSRELFRSIEEKEEVSPVEPGKRRPLLKDGDVSGEKDGSAERREILAYSPEESLREKDFAHLQKEELEAVRKAILHLARKISMNLSRRWKKGSRGDQLDFRRSIRRSIKYGGEMIELRMRKPKPKPLRLVLICDVSGSMDVYSEFFLLFMYGLQNHYPHCETFTFSTRLNHVSFLLKRRAFEEALQFLSRKVLDWSGGTNIGLSLHQFHQRHSELLQPDRTLLLIFSDGWDRGEIALLDSEMKYIRKQAKGIVWLNPLLGSRNYQPLCKGMAAALPYLDHFIPYHNLSSLKDLAHLISRRGVVSSQPSHGKPQLLG